MSMRPRARCADLMKFSVSAGLVRSATIGKILRPVSLAISAAVRSNGSLRRAQIATSTPSRASARVIALPIPSLAPVTMAFLSLIARSMARLLPVSRHEFKHPFLRHDSRGGRPHDVVSCNRAAVGRVGELSCSFHHLEVAAKPLSKDAGRYAGLIAI